MITTMPSDPNAPPPRDEVITSVQQPSLQLPHGTLIQPPITAMRA